MKILAMLNDDIIYPLIHSIKNAANGCIAKDCERQDLITAIKKIHLGEHYCHEKAAQDEYAMMI